MNERLICAVLFAATALAACGGGGGSDDADTSPAPAEETSVPASAMNSTAALMKYARAMVAASSEAAEPLGMPDAAMPVSDTTEAEALE